jgi:hypothetical protein
MSKRDLQIDLQGSKRDLQIDLQGSKRSLLTQAYLGLDLIRAECMHGNYMTTHYYILVPHYHILVPHYCLPTVLRLALADLRTELNYYRKKRLDDPLHYHTTNLLPYN